MTTLPARLATLDRNYSGRVAARLHSNNNNANNNRTRMRVGNQA